MKDENKTKAQLISEMKELRQKISDVENIANGERLANEKFLAITNAAVDFIFCKNINRQYTFVSRSMTEFLGCNESDLLGKIPEEIYDEKVAAVMYEVDLCALNGENVSEVRTLPIEGELCTFHTIRVPLRDSDGNIVGLSGIVRDITELKEAEQELLKSQYKLEEAQRRAKIGNWELNIPTNTLIWSKELYYIFGVNEKNYKPTPENFAQLIHPDDVSYVMAPETFEKNNRAGNYEMEYRVIDQKTKQTKHVYFWGEAFFDSDGNPIKHIGTFQDITVRKQLEAQLLQSQKMEAIGTLAGGIAHDFNNLLASVLGYTELVQSTLDPGGNDFAYLRNVVTAANRAKDLAQKILIISRPSLANTEPVKLINLVEEVVTVLKASISMNINIRQEIHPNIPFISADPSEIYQVILNLCTNAVQAMQEGGELLLSLTKAEQRQGREEEFLCLTIEDNGCGMDAATMERIYEPFFTTKERMEQRGTGLGLSIVSSLVKQHMGQIEVESKLGIGTQFRIYFPVSVEDEALSINKTESSIVSENKHILLVDDEQMLCNMGTSILENLGYRVSAFTNVHKALEVFEEKPQEFQLVITDYSMPHLTGPQFMKKIRAICSDIPILLVTGYSNLAKPENLQEWGCDCIIAKPYSIKNLGQTVSQLLEKVKE